MGRLAILGGAGQLPVMVQKHHPDALAIGFEGMPTDLSHATTVAFEHMGGLFETLTAAGVDRVCMVGGLSRPNLDPSQFDEGMRHIAPRLMQAMAGGDDGLLREIIALFAERGFETVGAHTLVPEITASAGVLTQAQPSDADFADIARADAILRALSPVDVGQAVVVGGGLCIGIETVQGTDALLAMVKETPEHLRRAKGVLVKRPKVGQDLRVDMPTIGVATVKNASDAGLAGIALTPGEVLLLDQKAIVRKADALGLFLIASDPA